MTVPVLVAMLVITFIYSLYVYYQLGSLNNHMDKDFAL